MKRFRALIFDVDGTMAETEELHRRAFNESFEYFRLKWSWDVDLYRKLLAVRRRGGGSSWRSRPRRHATT